MTVPAPRWTGFKLPWALRRSARPSALLGLLLFGVLAMLWGLFAGFTVSERSATETRVERELATLADTFADYAVALAETDTAAGLRPLDSALDRQRLAAFHAALRLPSGAQLRLWRLVDGAWLAGDPAAAGSAMPSRTSARTDGRLTVVAERARNGVLTAADQGRREALAGWRAASLTQAAGLGLVTLMVCALGAFLVRQFGRGEASEARWRTLIDHTSDGVYLIRVDAPIAGASLDALRFIIETVNPAGAAVWLGPDDRRSLVGKDVGEILPGWAREYVLAQYRACVASGQPCRYEVAAPDDSFVRESIAVPLREDPHGGVTHLVVTTRDVAARKRRQQALNHALARAEEASRAKSEFLANTSHELRTPLNAVIGYAELLTTGIAGLLSPKQAEYVGIIHQSGHHLLQIITDILDLAQVEAGRLELNEETVEPRQIIESCVTLVSERIAAGGQSLVVEVAPEIPPVLVDPTRLKQILLNLLSNAVKFTPPGGTIVLRCRRQPDGGLLFVVSDTGAGMTAPEIVVALEVFGQVDGGLARRHDGTGLGLPLARRLIELHGGRLAIDSAKGHGTTASVSLPGSRIAPVEVAALSSNESPISESTGEPKIALLVDDDFEVRDAMDAMLVELGWQVVQVDGYGDAIRVLNGPHRIDMLISDVVMPPGPSGVELAHQAGRLRPGLPVLLVSGYVAEALGAVSGPSGLAVAGVAWPVLAKPFRVDGLAAALRTAVSRAEQLAHDRQTVGA
jgi:signal transduction histidine kinase/ActR/RegA family two-component response regulator